MYICVYRERQRETQREQLICLDISTTKFLARPKTVHNNV